ncbi:protein serrate [Nephila pilipes]|uniref:Delta-like protein n=1 Tax=Nephila pilipes TaxID=299642 RepID=A0A8X6NQ51_NEPPI|nr:protein serrate [Nephila pilipes]
MAKSPPRNEKTFTLLLDAIHQDQSLVPNGTHLERVIERHVFSGVQIPGMEWKIKGHRGRAARISYRYRVLCSPHYYDYTCAKFCRPRDDRFGHYKCDEQGDKVCLEGWQGPNCETAVCKLGCHPEHGFCTVPGECHGIIAAIQIRYLTLRSLIDIGPWLLCNSSREFHGQ